MKKLFCRIGLHWMSKHRENYVEYWVGPRTYEAECACGKKWWVYSKMPFVFKKNERMD